MQTVEDSLLAKQILATLRGGFSEPILQTTQELAPPHLWPELKDYFAQQVEAFTLLVETLRDPEHEPELYRSLSFFWLEKRFEWNRYNQIMQYQTVLRGDADPEVFLRGGMASAFLQVIETFLRPTDVDKLLDVAAEPLELISPNTAELKDFIRQRTQALATMEGALTRLNAPLQHLREQPSEAGDLEALLVTCEQGLEEMCLVGETASTVPMLLAWSQIEQSLPHSTRLNPVNGSQVGAALTARALTAAIPDLAHLAASVLDALPNDALITLTVRVVSPHQLSVHFTPHPPTETRATGFIMEGAGRYMWTSPETPSSIRSMAG